MDVFYALVLFINGLTIGLVGAYFLWGREKPKETKVETSPTVDEIEKAKKEREELIASQKAFQSMMGYNADIAYGVSLDDDLTAGGS